MLHYVGSTGGKMKTKDIAQVLAETNGEVKSGQRTAEEIDQIRQKTLAYEYLCHLEEAKKWMEACLREKLPPTTELEENLRNGVYLAKLGHFIAPDILSLNKIYDIEQKRYEIAGLQFRHTDNINYFLKCLKSMQLPFTFQPETTDIYDKKNMPRLIYCIHALSTHLFKLGKAPQIQDLYGKVNFTDEEIDAVSRELKKMGIQMPAFQKIGGLMTNSMAGDTAALHAAVIAINQTLTSQDQGSILYQLQNPSVRLKNINPDYSNFYYDTLLDAKEKKEQAALNRSLNDSYIPDAYDELLTQAEIQGHINNVNMQCALEILTDTVLHTTRNVGSALQNAALQLQRVSHDNSEIYRAELKPMMRSREWEERSIDNCQYWQSKLQKAVDTANDQLMNLKKRDEAVKQLNQVLQTGTEQEFYNALINPRLKIGHLVDDFAIPLYYEEMKLDRLESKTDLTHPDIVVSLKVLTMIANITKSIDSNNPDLVYEALSHEDAHVSNLEEQNKVKYMRALAAVCHEKEITEEICPLLTFIDIQECVDLVNEQCSEDNKVIDVLKNLNQAVMKNSRSEMMEALKHITVKLHKTTSPDDASLYLKLFKKCLAEKHSDGSELWLEDVEQVLQTVLSESESAQLACTILSQINDGLEKDNYHFTIECLQAANLQLSQKHKVQCYKVLKALKKTKEEKYSCKYVRYTTPGGNEVYIDLESCSYTWDRLKKVTESRYITKDDIENVIRNITISEASLKTNKDFERLIIRLQACIRGYLLRKKIANNMEKIVKIQAWWRGQLQRRVYAKLLERRLKSSADEASKYVKAKARYLQAMDHYRQQESKIIKIQALWRGRAARRAFHSLLRMDKPPFSVVRHFSGILNINAEDYDRDLQLQQLKTEVVQLIKHNQKLSYQLNNMDIKIGLLIQNRVTLQDVVAHGKNLENLTKDKGSGHRHRHNSMSSDTYSTYKGLKSLTKEGRRMLEGYQHLFYSLQTNPTYLSKLLFLLPQSKSNKFVHNVILTLFNFGSNSREEYLFLKLLGTALADEIRCKFQKPSEVVTATPMVLKMAVNYARQVNGQRALREILGSTIEKILDDKTISIETNPVDIYKCWRNQLEMEKGESLDLPYSVTEQQALQYEDVRKRLSKSIRILQTTVLELLNKITSSRDLIPYGMLYMAKILYRTLSEKFPETPEKDILKVVGNLIYYHFINAAIVAPDAFDIVTLPMQRTLSNDQRRNLASIAKILQFATSKKGFDEEATHLVCLNSFIIQCHEQFKKFFRYCCEVEELDDHFNMHEYAEATLIHMPEIVISLQEICDTHCLLLEYQYQIAPNPMDSLHELLEDLGNAPSVATLLGLPDTVSETDIARLGKTEVNLVLSNKFEVPNSDDSSLSRLFIKTKELLVSVLQFLKGDSLVDALRTSSSPIQEKLYTVRTLSMIPVVHHKSSSLNDCKMQLQAYLHKLEMGGWVSREDGYQTIITAVAKDLCNKGRYRVVRNKELLMLRSTKQSLEEKANYYKEQVEYYNMYLKQCKANLNAGKGTLQAHKVNNKNSHSKLKSKMTLKYSAARLHEKGIVLSIDGLSKSQFKNVMFEITPTDNDGIFTVRGKFMGVEMEKVDVDVTRLLEMQYDGSPIMNMFGKARINVNLLLYLLNRKFYGKK